MPFRRNSTAAALIMRCRVSAASCFDFLMVTATSPLSGGSYRVGSDPMRNRAADCRTGILLDEMHSGHRNLGLVLPAAAELTHGSDQDCAGVSVHEQLWNLALRKPFAVSPHDGSHIGGLAANRNLPRPRKSWPANLPPAVGPAAFPPFLFAQLANI